MLEKKKLEHSNKEHVFATSPENKEKNRNTSVLPGKINIMHPVLFVSYGCYKRRRNYILFILGNKITPQ